MAEDWEAAITEARRQGRDLTDEMTDADWAEYREQCRTWLNSSDGQTLKRRALGRVAAKQAVVDEAS